MTLRSLKDIDISGGGSRADDPGNTYLRMSEEDAKLLEFLIQVDASKEDTDDPYAIIREYEDHMDYLRKRLFECEKIVDSTVKKEEP